MHLDQKALLLQPKNNWRVAKSCKKVTPTMGISITQWSSMLICAGELLEEAYAQGEHIVNCTLDIDALAPNDIHQVGADLVLRAHKLGWG